MDIDKSLLSILPAAATLRMGIAIGLDSSVWHGGFAVVKARSGCADSVVWHVANSPHRCATNGRL